MGYLDDTTKLYGDDISIEIGILQQEIELPEISTDPLNIATLTSYNEEDTSKEYILPHRVYTNVIGNFYIPILFALIENGESTELEFSAPSTSNIINESLASSAYIERNFISLMIPKYIVMQFTDTIPKDTKFLIAFIGGSTSIDNMSVIGLYGQDLEV